TQPGRRRWEVREGPHLQLQGEPGHRPPRQPDSPQAGPDPHGRARRDHRCAAVRRAGGAAARRGLTVTATWRDLLDRARRRLGSDVDARRLVEQASGHEGGEWARNLDDQVPARAAAHFEAMLVRRESGEPLQYVLGSWAFRSLELMVDPRVLIPRPETEQVVEVALGEIRRHRRPVVADLGTGSGAIALSVVAEVAGAQGWAA